MNAPDPADTTQLPLVQTLADMMQAELTEIERRRPKREQGKGLSAPAAKSDDPDAQWIGRAAKMELTALCLSGGGIRSAAFCLGAVQALAKAKLLNQFDYVSSVSGGGYVSAWLQTLLRDRCLVGGDKVDRVLDELGDGAAELGALRRLRGFAAFLTPQPGPASPDAWAGITLYLRNFIVSWMVFLPALLLAALLPIFYRTALAWVVFSTRHASLTWLLIPLGIGTACLVFATVQACRLLPSHRARGHFARPGAIQWLVLPAVVVWAYTLPFIVAGARLASHQQIALLSDFRLSNPGNAYDVWLDAQRLIIPVAYLLAMLAGYGMASIAARKDAGRPLYRTNFLPWLIASMLSACLIWVALSLAATDNPLYNLATTEWADGTHILVDTDTALTVFAPVLLIAIHLLQTTFYVALRRRGRFAELDREWLGRLNGLVLRTALGLAVVSFCALILPEWLGLVAGQGVWQHRNLTGAAGSATLLAAAAAWAGKFVKAQIEEVANHTDQWRTLLASPLVLNVLCLAAGVLIFAFAGGMMQHLIGLLQQLMEVHPTTGDAWPSWAPASNALLAQLELHRSLDCIWGLAAPLLVRPVALHPCALTNVQDLWNYVRQYANMQPPNDFGLPLFLQFLTGLLLGLCVWQFGKINVNRFSLHAVYRNRLVRAFLGAARRNSQRTPDPFTGLDLTNDRPPNPAQHPESQDDNPRLRLFRVVPNEQRLFPVINTTLNISAGTNNAWAERKGACFIATPLYCGSAALRHGRHNCSGQPRGAFVKTEQYAGMDSRRDSNGKNNGATLGTMMTISGAAISPNWGYHSSPATAFVMTLFNVRLGAWLPNPGWASKREFVLAPCARPTARTVADDLLGPALARLSKGLQLARPRHSLRALLSDLFARTTDTRQAIYLSDGGHFENLGMYEMLRRRCRYLVVIDAGQDADCKFFDLGNAIRKAAIDFNIEIRMRQPMRIRSRKTIEACKKDARDALGFAVGAIAYPDAPQGCIIYVKPSFLPDIPADVRAFGLSNPSFPHVSTVDQWFTESEFESYRALGEWQMQQLTEEMPHHINSQDLPRPDPDIALLWTAANALQSKNQCGCELT